MPGKSLTVLGNEGSGKKTLVAYLSFTCGGVGLPQIEKLECERSRKDKKIMPLCGEAYAQFFYSPSGEVTVQSSQTPDIAFWVVDGSSSSTWVSSAGKLAGSLSCGALQPREKLIIVVNKMDTDGWSERKFQDAVHAFTKVGLNDRYSTCIIPVSGLQGHNILPDSQVPLWVKHISPERFEGSTLVSDKCLTRVLG